MARKSKKKSKVKSTFLKKPLESLATHLGKFADRLSGQDVIDLALYGMAGFYGYKAFGNFGGSAVGMVSLKLATAMNSIAGAAGVAGLTVIGLANVFSLEAITAQMEQSGEAMKEYQTQWGLPGYYIDPFVSAMQRDIARAEQQKDPAYQDYLERKRQGQLSPLEQTWEFNVYLEKYMNQGYSFNEAYSMAMERVG